MPIRCKITWTNGPALDGIWGVTWEEILQVTWAKEIKAVLWFASLSAFDLWAVTRYSLQMACMRLAAHCSPRYHRCHLVTPNSHTPVTQPTDRAKSWRVPNSPGPISVQLGKLLHNSLEKALGQCTPNANVGFNCVPEIMHTSVRLLITHF